MTQPIPVVVNRTGGTAARLGEGLRPALEEAFAAAGVAIDLHLVRADEVKPLIGRLAADAPIVVVGGGDGTLGCAAAAIGGRAALGILPLGTHNHLAKELGIPADLGAAAAIIAQRHERPIDLGEVNGEPFVNNASIGLYPALVRTREAEQERGRPKWLATLPATWAALKRLRHHRLRMTLADSARAVRTPLLFVGNNRYVLDAGHLGERAALDDGVLSIYAIAPMSRAGLILFAARALVGGADAERDFAALGEAARFTVEAHSGSIDVALDGETRRLSSPLHFSTRAGALRVLVAQQLNGG